MSVVLSLIYSISDFAAKGGNINVVTVWTGIIFHIVFVFDLINAFKCSHLNKNVILNITPIMVLFTVVSYATLLWL